MSIQLQFEEHRREIHAERNRRLLGRSRRNKTLEEYNNALVSNFYFVNVILRCISMINEDQFVIYIVKDENTLMYIYLIGSDKI